MEMPLYPIIYLFALILGFFLVAAVVNLILGALEKDRKIIVMAGRCVLLVVGVVLAVMVIVKMM
jgi:hypothetical protein